MHGLEIWGFESQAETDADFNICIALFSNLLKHNFKYTDFSPKKSRQIEDYNAHCTYLVLYVLN